MLFKYVFIFLVDDEKEFKLAMSDTINLNKLLLMKNN